MRAYIIIEHKSFNIEKVEIHFVDMPQVIATQKSVNKRINKDKFFGISFFDTSKICNTTVYWTIETNEEILKRYQDEYFNLVKIEIV